MGGWENNLEIDISTDIARTGNNSIFMKTEKSASPWIRQKVYVEEGAVYESSAWIKSDNLQGRGIITKIEFYKENGGWVSGHESEKFNKMTGDWQQIKFEIEVPKGARIAQVYYRLYHATGEAYFDDVSFVKVKDRPQIVLKTDQIFYYTDIAEGLVQAEIHPEDGECQGKYIDVNILKEETGEFFYSAENLDAAFDFEHAFNPQGMEQEQPYRVEISLKDSQGKVLEVQDTIIYRWERPSSLQPDGTLIVDGEPFFPIIGYHVLERDYPRVTESINTVQGWLTEDDNRMQNYLDSAHANGLKVLVPLYTNMRVKENFAQMERRIPKFKDHPAVLGWIIIDEPINNGIPLEELVEAYKLVRSMDSVHPTFIVEASTVFYEQTGKVTDILGIDPYPLPQSTITSVGNQTMAAKKAVGTKPVWTILQAYRKRAYDDFVPSITELRNMAYQTILEGAQGIGYYSFEDPNWDLTEHQLYEGIVKYKEEELPHISDFVLHSKQLGYYRDAEILWALWERDDEIYAAVINLVEDAQIAGVSLPAYGYDVQIIAPISSQYNIIDDQLTLDLNELESTLIKLKPFASSAGIRELVERFEKEGEFKNYGAARSLQAHLDTIERFEKQEAFGKVVKHTEDFKLLLDNQKKSSLVSEKAYKILKEAADLLIQRARES